MAEINRVSFCGRAGCMNLVENKRFCPKHALAERAAKNPYDRYYGLAMWCGRYGARGYHLRHFPMCERCGDVAATQVHHRSDEWKKTGDVREFINQENLESLCATCHSRVTMTRNNERKSQ